ncbi:MAG TPA: hypothetical protein VIK91_26495, partial [Nannocystis sp.]
MMSGSRALAVGLVLSVSAACYEGTTPSGFTGAPVTAASGQTGDPGTGDPTGPGDPTTGTTTSATSAPGCAELTLCPGTTTGQETTITTTPDVTGTTTQGPGTSEGTSEGTTDPNLPGDPCSGFGDGPHCGAELGGLADHNSVYECAGGMTVSVSPCEAGCENGACKVVPTDPCVSAMSGNGLYCGGTLMGGDAGALYHCVDGHTVSTTPCANGCKVNPPGMADACNPDSDPCQNAMSGDGPYCGSTLGGDPNDLYNCAGGVTVDKTPCPEGCQVNPPGQPDACKQVMGGACCLKVPPGVITQSFTACGGGGSHYGIDYGVAIG